jgi:PAS domain-containing protein
LLADDHRTTQSRESNLRPWHSVHVGTDETPTESVLQALVDAESDAALFLRPLRDPGAGFVVTNANPAAATLLNVTRSEPEPESDGPAPLHPDLLAVSQQAWETGRTEVREVLLPESAPRPLQVRCRRLGHLVEMICVDVRQRATDDALDPSPRGQAEHQRLRAVLDSSIDQQVVLNAVRDDTGQLQDLTCVDCNTAAARYLRRDRPDLLGRRLTSLFHGQSTEFTLTRAFEVIETGEPLLLSNHAMVSAITGDLRHFDISMVKTGDGVSFTWRDVTESLRAARLLRDSEETLRLAMLHSPVAFCLVSPTGEFLHVNPAMCQLLGRDEVRSTSGVHLSI